MDVRQLRYFLAVVEHGGVTRAAEALYLAQPSLSQALRAFERQVGVRLFDRGPAGLVLTAQGAALVEPARRILADLDAARDAVGAVAELNVGRLDVAADSTLAMDPLARITGRLHRRHPGLVVDVAAPADAVDVPEAVRRGRFEIGLAGLPVRTPGLHARPLGSQELCLVLPPGSDLPDPVALRALERIALVLPTTGSPIRATIDRAFVAAGATAWVAVECDHLEALANMVLEGAGATFFPAAFAAAWGRAGAVVRTTRPAPVREIGLVHRAGPLTPGARAFLDAADHPD